MSDVIDEAQAAAELLTRAELSQRAAEGPVPCGFCHYCSEPLPLGLRWCNADCRDDWQAEQDAAERRGQSGGAA